MIAHLFRVLVALLQLLLQGTIENGHTCLVDLRIVLGGGVMGHRGDLVHDRRQVLATERKIADVADRLGVTIEPEGFETVGGYLLAHLGRVPVKGERFDANAFLTQARAAGAVAALCSDEAALRASGLDGLVVDDSKLALAQLATAWRARGPAAAVAASSRTTTQRPKTTSISPKKCSTSAATLGTGTIRPPSR